MAKKPAKEAVELAAPEKKKRTTKPPERPVTEPARKKRGRPTKAEKAEQERKIREAQMHRQLTTAEWRKIRTEYIKGKTTYKKLSEKYSISASVIRKRASSERWTQRKNQLDTKVEQKTVERVAEARARELEKLAAIQEKVDDFLDAAVEAIGQVPLKKYDEMRGIESLTKAIQIAVQTKRDLYNIPNEADRAKIESLREKAKLDRQRYEDEKAEKAKMAQAAENTMIRVVIEGEGGALDE